MADELTTREWLVIACEMRKAAKQARANGYLGVAEEYEAIVVKTEARYDAAVADVSKAAP